MLTQKFKLVDNIYNVRNICQLIKDSLHFNSARKEHVQTYYSKPISIYY